MAMNKSYDKRVDYLIAIIDRSFRSIRQIVNRDIFFGSIHGAYHMLNHAIDLTRNDTETWSRVTVRFVVRVRSSWKTRFTRHDSRQHKRFTTTHDKRQAKTRQDKVRR